MDAASWEFSPAFPPPPFLGPGAAEISGPTSIASIVRTRAPFFFEAGLDHIATGDNDLYHEPWRIIASQGPGLPPGDAEPSAPPFLEPAEIDFTDPADALSSGPAGDAMLLPGLDSFSVEGTVGPRDRFDLYRLPLTRDLRDLNVTIHNRLPDGGAGPLPDLAVWLYDTTGRAMGRWRVAAGKALDLDLLSVRAPRSSELILAIEQLYPTSSTGGSAGEGATSTYGMDVSRSYREQPVPGSTGSDPDYPMVEIDGPGTGKEGTGYAGTGWGSGGTSYAPLLVSGGSDSAPPLAAPAPTDPGTARPTGKSSPTQAAPPATGLGGADQPVDAEGGGEGGPDPESEPLPERLVRLSRSANRKAEAGDLGLSITAVDAHDPSAGPSGAGESIDRVLESWDGPTLAASLLVAPDPLLPPAPSDRRAEGAVLLSATPLPPAPPASRPPGSAGGEKPDEEAGAGEKAPGPTVQTALVTTAALVVGLWLPDLGSPRRPTGARRRLAAFLRRLRRGPGRTSGGPLNSGPG
jgi:hypothetical protein